MARRRRTVHFAIAQIAKNELFSALHRAVLGWLREQRIASSALPASMAAAHRAHGRVLDAIAARDPDGAEAAMQDHLDEVSDFYWKARRMGEDEGAAR